MKFGHDFKEALQREGFPEHWIQHAIPYSQLKKCLKKILNELREFGLDPEIIKQLVSPSVDAGIKLKYDLEESSKLHALQPKLTIFVHVRDGTPIDVTLTPTSKRILQRILDRQNGMEQDDDDAGLDLSIYESSDTQPKLSRQPTATLLGPVPTGNSEVLKVPLHFDAEFFEVLQREMTGLELIQAQEEKVLSNEITSLRNVVAIVSRPSRFSRTDVDRWREVFNIYIEAEVFFSTCEISSGARNSTDALQKLQWFQNETQKRQLDKGFLRSQSRDAFSRFLQLNVAILKNMQFQEINRMAVMKILKKFDKRTSFGISKVFPQATDSKRIMSGSIAKDMCAAVSSQLVSLVPQLNDYLCPVCFAITWRAIRLSCNHVYCIRCVIKMQRRHDNCPLCRSNTVGSACTDNLDFQLEHFLKKNFRVEVNEKSVADEIEYGIEQYGDKYRKFSCIVM
ncbi:RING-14 protein [Ceratocystis lukuohia]|uniref:RING-14 protein n=1 Tax=Ceratocystis lukuohia TaxID=2019550 RepID=A0ABR4MLA2_9PEZI